MRLGENELHVHTILQCTLHIYVYTSLNFKRPWNKASTASASADHLVSDRFLGTFILFGRVLSRTPTSMLMHKEKRRPFAPPQKMTRHLHMYLLQICQRDLVNALRMGSSQLRGSHFSTGPACRCTSQTYYWHYHNSGLDNFEC